MSSPDHLKLLPFLDWRLTRIQPPVSISAPSLQSKAGFPPCGECNPSDPQRFSLDWHRRRFSALQWKTIHAYRLPRARAGAARDSASSLAKELGPRKVRVNALNPGFVKTEGTTSYLGSDFEKGLIAQTPLGRIGQPDDIAAVAVFLASDEFAWITGEQPIVSGGLR
jgi:hypothetical protein